MELPTEVLGLSTVTKLKSRHSAAVLVIGGDKFTRPELSKVGCFNFLAAARLSELLKELEVKSTRDLFQNFGPQHLALPGLGSICLATVGAAFEVKQIGTLKDYVARHFKKGDQVVTFSTMKIHILDQQAAANEKRELKKRAGSRQRTAHEHRVRRHVERHTPPNN